VKRPWDNSVTFTLVISIFLIYFKVVVARCQLLFWLYHSNEVTGWAGLLAGQGCWLGWVAGWVGLLAGQGCWLRRVAGWAGLLAGQGWYSRI